MMNEEGVVSLKVQYIDGTKIESVANKYTFVWKGSIEKNKAKLEAKVDAVLKAAESVLAEENEECSAEEPSMMTFRRVQKGYSRRWTNRASATGNCVGA